MGSYCGSSCTLVSSVDHTVDKADSDYSAIMLRLGRPFTRPHYAVIAALLLIIVTFALYKPRSFLANSFDTLDTQSGLISNPYFTPGDTEEHNAEVAAHMR